MVEFNDLRIQAKPGLSDYLVCLFHLASLKQPNKPGRPNRPDEQDRLADLFIFLLGLQDR